MNAPTQALAVLNCGSSSIKFALFDASTAEPPRQPWWGGQVRGFGSAQPSLQTAGRPEQPRRRSGRAEEGLPVRAGAAAVSIGAAVAAGGVWP